MSRRLLSIASVLWMMLAISGLPRALHVSGVDRWAGWYFSVLLVLQVLPLAMTHFGLFGHRRHPVNALYGLLSAIGILGSGLLALAIVIDSSAGMAIVAGAFLFTGVVGGAVLALSASPWRDWTFRQRR